MSDPVNLSDYRNQKIVESFPEGSVGAILRDLRASQGRTLYVVPEEEQ
jgi:hypothetical protein